MWHFLWAGAAQDDASPSSRPQGGVSLPGNPLRSVCSSRIPPPRPLATSLALPLPEGLMVGLGEQPGSAGWLLSPSHVCRRLFHVFSRLDGSSIRRPKRLSVAAVGGFCADVAFRSSESMPGSTAAGSSGSAAWRLVRTRRDVSRSGCAVSPSASPSALGDVGVRSLAIPLGAQGCFAASIRIHRMPHDAGQPFPCLLPPAHLLW